MEKYHKIVSVVFALGFLVLMQQFPVQEAIFRFLAMAMAGFLLVLTLYNRWYLKKTDRFTVWTWLRPTLFYFLAFVLAMIIPMYFMKGIFLVATVVMGIAFEVFLGHYSENVILNEILLISFGVCISGTALNFYFPAFHTLYLLGIFFTSLFIIRSYFDVLPQPPRLKLAVSSALALLTVELFWAITFLPFHYSVQGLLLFNFFYFIVTLTFYAMFHILNTKKIKFHFLLMAFSAVLVLLATPWRVIQ